MATREKHSKFSTISEPTINIDPVDFESFGEIPDRFLFEDENRIPTLKIRNVPSKAKSLALIMRDEDTPGESFTNWIMYNISPDETEISEQMETGVYGKNSYTTKNYHGPCPIRGRHYYSITILALDKMLKEEDYTTDELTKKIMASAISSSTILAYAEKEGDFALE